MTRRFYLVVWKKKRYKILESLPTTTSDCNRLFRDRISRISFERDTIIATPGGYSRRHRDDNNILVYVHLWRLHDNKWRTLTVNDDLAVSIEFLFILHRVRKMIYFIFQKQRVNIWTEATSRARVMTSRARCNWILFHCDVSCLPCNYLL